MIPGLRRAFRRPIRFNAFDTSLDGAIKIRDRKSMWMVQYLRARQSGDCLLGYYRQHHLATMRHH